MNNLDKLKKVAEILKKRFGNLTVAETIDLASEIIGVVEEAEKVSESRGKHV